MFSTSKDSLTAEEVCKYVDLFKTSKLPRLKKLKRYFDNKNDGIKAYWTKRNETDSTKPNNVINTPWASYITNTLTGYFMGSPVVYACEDSNLYDDISTILKGNDEGNKNYAIALNMSIYGVAYELDYIENKEFKFDIVSPENVIPIYDNTIGHELKFVIRFWDEEEDVLTGKTFTYAQLYDDKNVTTFKGTLGKSFDKLSEEEHYIGRNPIIIYKNTKGFIGDFEKLMALIDGYDIAMADTLNFREELNDSYLILKNTNLEDEDILKMRHNRIFQVEDGADGVSADIEWLTKDSNDGESENLKNRLAEDIKTFSYISELEVKSHTTASGNSLQLIGLESVISQKEHNFRKALNKRLDNIVVFLNLLGEDYLNDFTIKFTRNLPLDMNVEADILSKVAPYVTHETLLGLMSFIPNPKLESDNWKMEQKELKLPIEGQEENNNIDNND